MIDIQSVLASDIMSVLKKGGNLCNVIMCNVIWINQKTEVFA